VTVIYRHTQRGTLVLALVGLAILVVIAVVAAAGFHPVTVAVVVLLGALAILFGSLTVEVTGQALSLRFGPGPIGRGFPLSEIRDARVVRNRWYYGWGIRWTPRGWLFNVSGLDAVEIEMRDGRRYRIGTDEPEALRAAIEGATRNAEA
jgi:hypothetical protein